MGRLVVEEVAGARCVALAGEHDLATAPRLAAALADAREARAPVVVELVLATFIDSTILGTLLAGLRAAQVDGRGFTFVVHDEPSSPVGRVLELSGLLAAFPAYPTRGLAIGASLEGVNRAIALDPST